MENNGTRLLQCFERLYRGREFHPIIGGAPEPARQFPAMLPVLQDSRVTPGARIAGARAVSKNDDLFVTQIHASRSGLAVDRPRDVEPIDDHAEPLGPERLLERHHDSPIGSQSMKDALGL